MTSTVAAATSVLAYKHLPPEIRDALLQPLGWLLWLVTGAFIFRIMLIGAQLWHAHRDPSFDGPDSWVIVVVGSIVAGSASGTAAALLSPP